MLNCTVLLKQKTAGAIRGNISNAANISQSLLLAAFNSDEYAQQKEAKHNIMQQRYDAVKAALNDDKYKEYFETIPYNSGYFMCVQLADGLSGDKVRQTLIEKYSIGLISLGNVLRIAYSAVAAKDMKNLFDGIYKACKDCS